MYTDFKFRKSRKSEEIKCFVGLIEKVIKYCLKIEMIKNTNVYLYESEARAFLLTEKEEKIMRAMRRLDKLWKDYKNNPQENHLILFGGGGTSIRINSPSKDHEIETYANITSEGGDGGDYF